MNNNQDCRALQLRAFRLRSATRHCYPIHGADESMKTVDPLQFPLSGLIPSGLFNYLRVHIHEHPLARPAKLSFALLVCTSGWGVSSDM